jgi:hypothetical protein
MLRFRPGLALLPLLLAAAPTAAQQDSPPVNAQPSGQASPASPPPTPAKSASDAICLMMESAASANGLPLEFFVRLIWKESRFHADAIGPRTRSGERASGIAQFMPGTAAERGLLDPLDPIHALPKSAEYLGDLRREFGNLGLAAAAYNAGPRRVHAWLTGAGGLPSETRDYVLAITGRTAEDWKTGRDAAPGRTDKSQKAPDCPTLVASLKATPTGFAAALEHRIEAGAAKPWGVELFAGFSRDRVVHAYAAIAAKYAEALAGAEALILRDTFRSRGTRAFYQVRAGADSRHDADRMCARLRSAGAACLVLRNLRGKPEAIAGPS